MGLASQVGALSAVHLLSAVDATNTAAATSAYVAVDDFEGDIAAVCNIGVMDDGSITWTFLTAEDGGGTGEVALVPTGGNLATVLAANDTVTQIAHFPATAVKGYIKCVGTIVTGGCLVAVSLVGRKKYAA